MEQKLQSSINSPLHWSADIKNESQNLDDLIQEVFKETPENSIMKTLKLDDYANTLICEAIERIFRAIILEHADIFAETEKYQNLSDEKEDLETKLIEALGQNSHKLNSEEFTKSSKKAFQQAGVALELAENGTPKHLKTSVARQVVKEIVLTASEVMKHHRGDYLCKVAKQCEYRDRLVKH